MSSHCDMTHLLQFHSGRKSRGVVDTRNAEVFTWCGFSFITAGYENDRRARPVSCGLRGEGFLHPALLVRRQHLAVIRVNVVPAGLHGGERGLIELHEVAKAIVVGVRRLTRD